jgi:AraC-like DNA-binding protein
MLEQRQMPKTRETTLSVRQRGIERAVDAMRQRLGEPMALSQMARIALMSPFHFNRVFHAMTGIPPCRFLTALRIEAAKKLLLKTRMSVTSVCFEVGYESLGSFITRFSQQVGASPRTLRRLARDSADQPMLKEWPPMTDDSDDPARRGAGSVRGTVVSDGAPMGMVFIGLFAENAPHGTPIRCSCRRGPGKFSLGPVPDGQWYLFAASFPEATGSAAYLLPDDCELGVAKGLGPVRVVGGWCDTSCELTLRQARPTDPPILVALSSSLAREPRRAGLERGRPTSELPE